MTKTHDHPAPALEKTSDGGRYVIAIEGGKDAVLSFRWSPEGHAIASHTGVPSAHRGEGLALDLVNALVSDAREKGFKIVPRCSYVAHQFSEHPSWSDLRAA